MSELKSLLNPRSVAVVGASDQSGTGKVILDNLRMSGFSGSIFPVNPKYDLVSNLPCYPDLSKIPCPVDLAVLAIPAEAAVPVFRKIPLGQVRSAILLSSGFREAGPTGEAFEVEVAEIAKDLGIRLCGPNCLGLINVHGGLAAFSASLQKMPRAGGIGAIAQSGTISIGWINARSDLGFSHIVSVGNEADVTCGEYIRYLVDDPNTNCIALFLEGVRSPEVFLSALEAAQTKGKPVVVLKAGQSKMGKRASLAHTGSLAGSDRVCKGLFKQKGVIQVSDLEEQLATLGFISQKRFPRGNGLGVATISGGQCALVCDFAENIGLELPELSSLTASRLSTILPDFGTAANPLDITGVGVYHENLYEESLRALVEDPGIHSVAVLHDVPSGLGSNSKKNYHRICEAIVRVSSSTDKPLVQFTHFGGAMDSDMQQTLRNGGVPLLFGMAPSLQAVHNVIQFAERAGRARASILRSHAIPDSAIVSRLRNSTGLLSERESKEILACCGIPVPQEEIAKTLDDAICFAEKVGFPVVLKVDSPDLPHKTEAGAVCLGLKTKDEVRVAYHEILDSVSRFKPDTQINGVLVQEQISPGVELIIGLGTDLQFGKTILVGMGGVEAEIMEDVALRLLPITELDAEEMLGELRISRVLKGFRGRGPSDKSSLIHTLVALSDMGCIYGDHIKELDVNPLIVGPEGDGVTAVDALIVPGNLQLNT